mgnify:CR=1 FL=1
MKVLVIGKNGQLGRSIFKLATILNNKELYEFKFIGRDELDLSKLDEIEKYIDQKDFNTIVNAAAYTSVDEAEENIKSANEINNLAVKKIAEISLRNNINLIHISTDYVFDGKSSKPYAENDKTCTINIYGETKLAGEKAIQKIMKNNATIIRTSWVYSEFGNNFVDTMMRLSKRLDEVKVVRDQIGSPTYATDLAELIFKVIDCNHNHKKRTEIYHFSNEGEVSWDEFAKMIFRLSGINCRVIPIESKHFMTKAVRPKNSIMNKIKIQKDFNIKISCWKKSLNKAIKLIDNNK